MQEIDGKFKKSGGIFKEYKIGELFEASNGDTDIQAKHINGKDYYVVSSGLLNCGIIGKSDIKAKIFNENTITIDMFGNVFVRDFKYKLVTHARVFSLKLKQEPQKNIYIKILLYIATQLSFLNKVFSYNNMCSYNKIVDFKITLPTLNNELAFEYMEERIRELESERIRELESERIRELEAYLQATGLNNYILDEKDRGGVNRLLENKIELKEYKIGYLFEVKNNPQLNKEYFIFSDKGQYPYFTRTVANNGILGYVEYLNEKNKINGNSIAVGMLGMQFFYMEKDFYAGQFTKTIYPKFKYFNEKIALYFTALFNLHSKRYQGVLVRNFEHTFLNTKIYLPTLNNNIDFNYMEQLIKTLEKIMIKDVIDFKDKIIKTHKEICKI